MFARLPARYSLPLQASPTTTPIASAGQRTFQTSSRHLVEAPLAALPVRKPIGAFRGGIFGFLLGTSLGVYGSYYYLFEQYRQSNDMLTEDIYALQAAVSRLHNYVTAMEEKIEALEKGNKKR